MDGMMAGPVVWLVWLVCYDVVLYRVGSFPKWRPQYPVGSRVVVPWNIYERILEVRLDRCLDMSKPPSRSRPAGFFHLRHLRQMRKILGHEHRQLFLSAVILSRIDYCNPLLVGPRCLCYSCSELWMFCPGYDVKTHPLFSSVRR